MAKVATDPPTRNQLLATLPPREFRWLLPHLKLVSLDRKDVLHEVYKPIEYVYFPENALITKLAFTEDGHCIDVGIIGREGMAGICLLFGANMAPFSAVVQIPGTARRMKAAAFQVVLQRGGSLTNLLQRYAHAVLCMLSQSAACNGLHSVDQRCCRLFLMLQDRVDGKQFHCTQETLALMLGVTRPFVTRICHDLSDKKLVRYRWGKVTILDRQGLEARACGCYQIIQQHFAWIF